MAYSVNYIVRPLGGWVASSQVINDLRGHRLPIPIGGRLYAVTKVSGYAKIDLHLLSRQNS